MNLKMSYVWLVAIIILFANVTPLAGVCKPFDRRGAFSPRPVTRGVVAPFDDDYHERINGVTLHFRVRGVDKTNPYVLILHGGLGGAGAFGFYPWGASLERELNVVYLDQRGSGGSTRLRLSELKHPQPGEIEEYTMDNLVSDVDGVRRFLK